jgi:hypothetical protein
MARKIQIFNELMKGFRDAIARKRGNRVALRVTRLPRLKRPEPDKKDRPDA